MINVDIVIEEEKLKLLLPNHTIEKGILEAKNLQP
jgi:hypothetical protein